MSKAVIVCGPRWWGDSSMLRDRSPVDYDDKATAEARSAEAVAESQALASALEALPSDTLVIHGAAPGADTAAAMRAQSLKLPVASVPYFGHLGRAGGPARNRAMLAMLLGLKIHEGWLVKVVAFVAPGEGHSAGGVEPRLGGTLGMIELANQAGIWVTQIEPSEAPSAVDNP